MNRNGANIRISAVQSHVRDHVRAKVNALFSVLILLSMTADELLSGAPDECLPYGLIRVAFPCAYLIGIFFSALPRRNKVRGLCNYAASTPPEAAVRTHGRSCAGPVRRRRTAEPSPLFSLAASR